MLEKFVQIHRLPAAAKKNISSLQNWVNGNGSISRNEWKFLHADDLFTTMNPADDALAMVESRVEDLFVRFHQKFKKVCLGSPPWAERIVFSLSELIHINLASCFSHLSRQTCLHLYRVSHQNNCASNRHVHHSRLAPRPCNYRSRC